MLSRVDNKLLSTLDAIHSVYLLLLYILREEHTQELYSNTQITISVPNDNTLYNQDTLKQGHLLVLIRTLI